ncbi:MAG: metallophosphoesterase [Leptospiraceae bacterium]|nr:metallophosphoesterase [Leptospiraceae bacterium]
MYDIIGDIHGHSGPLERLLHKLEYRPVDGVYSHPKRKALFLGDFIDRGTESRKVVSIVRKMVERGHAKAIMGNHEWNALQFHSRDSNGNPLRPHSTKNIKQHAATLQSYGCEGLEPSEALKSDLEWFRTLPLFFEEDGLRAVHATWDEKQIQQLKYLYPDGVVGPGFLQDSIQTGESHSITETLLKGAEVDLPSGVVFYDKDGHPRTSARVRWWKGGPTGGGTKARDFLFVPQDWDSPDLALDFLERLPVYPSDAAPVFFGHYWMEPPLQLQSHNVCCLDYSVAKNGALACYRWNGEERLTASSLEAVMS